MPTDQGKEYRKWPCRSAIPILLLCPVPASPSNPDTPGLRIFWNNDGIVEAGRFGCNLSSKTRAACLNQQVIEKGLGEIEQVRFGSAYPFSK